MTIEFCIQSYEEMLATKRYGAKRVELCSALSVGGLTPSGGMMKACNKIEGVEVHVLIRPRTGGFCYSDDEFEIMKSDIKVAHREGSDGVVFGILNEQNEIDLERNQVLLDLAKSLKMEATFHRAFDFVKEPLMALDQLIEMGFSRILTSGQKPTAIEGIELIDELTKQARGRIEIMAGSGVNGSNAAQIKNTGIDALHFTIGKSIASDDHFGMGSLSQVDTRKIELIVETLGDRL